MDNQFERAIIELGLRIPEPSNSVANFVPWVVTNHLLVISGQIPVVDGRPGFIGKVGLDLSVEEGQLAARACALQILSVVRQACDGDLDRVVKCVRLGGFINSTPEFTSQPMVMNGASDLIVAVFKEQGRHARVAVGVNSLPFGVAVEVDAIFEVTPRP